MTFAAGPAIRILLAIFLLGAALVGEYRSLEDGITAAEMRGIPPASTPRVQTAIRQFQHRADLETAGTLLAFAAACVALGTALGSLMGKSGRCACGYLLGVALCILTFLLLNLIGVVLLRHFG